MDESNTLAPAQPAVDFTLRSATPDDFPFAWTLYRDLMRGLSQDLHLWHEKAQRALIRSTVNGGDVSIIVANRRPVGWLQLQDADDALYLHQLYIAPEYQGRGIGTRLIESILRRAREMAVPVHLWVVRNNDHARRLYQRLGFEMVEQDRVKFHLVWQDGARPPD
jgi:ribosomal protein S18 acetylase RimI-like enzyme